MTLATNNVQIRDGSNSTQTLAALKPGGTSDLTSYQIVAIADGDGHVAESVPTYLFNVPPIVTAANRFHWELFNNSLSTATLALRGIWPIVNSDQAIAGAVSAGMLFYRTTAISSGGTAGAYGSSSSIIPVINRMDTRDSQCSSGISLKCNLTSITTGDYLFAAYVFTEETNTATILQSYLNLIPDRVWGKELILRPGEGIACKQGPTVSAGSIGWFGQFTLK